MLMGVPGRLDGPIRQFRAAGQLLRPVFPRRPQAELPADAERRAAVGVREPGDRALQPVCGRLSTTRRPTPSRRRRRPTTPRAPSRNWRPPTSACGRPHLGEPGQRTGRSPFAEREERTGCRAWGWPITVDARAPSCAADMASSTTVNGIHATVPIQTGFCANHAHPGVPGQRPDVCGHEPRTRSPTGLMQPLGRTGGLNDQPGAGNRLSTIPTGRAPTRSGGRWASSGCCPESSCWMSPTWAAGLPGCAVTRDYNSTPAQYLSKSPGARPAHHRLSERHVREPLLRNRYHLRKEHLARRACCGPYPAVRRHLQRRCRPATPGTTPCRCAPRSASRTASRCRLGYTFSKTGGRFS